ncbi:MAG TPA: putative zinc-binding metallopeptidase [Polyangiaceae bacterium]
MRTFRCTCGARVFFENSRCLACQRELGFLRERLELCALEPAGGELFEAAGGRYRKCSNYVEQGVCNWLVLAERGTDLCAACSLNRVIPDLSQPESRVLWGEVERAKRALLYGLGRIGLPVISKQEDPARGLAFDIKADTAGEHVLTGHSEGLVTLNLREADPAIREKVRVDMNERYRTLLGHFRHEVGHYFFDRLVGAGPHLDEFRELFGDERADYAAALARHYQDPPAPGFHDAFISSYARAHPAEDWAETFAHYLHLLDTLETGQHFGFAQGIPARMSLPGISDLDVVLAEWTELTIALNALNRSMGMPDAYPFAISPAVRRKLEFVHRVVRECREPASHAA